MHRLDAGNKASTSRHVEQLGIAAPVQAWLWDGHTRMHGDEGVGEWEGWRNESGRVRREESEGFL
jgi:hypothetical protein